MKRVTLIRMQAMLLAFVLLFLAGVSSPDLLRAEAPTESTTLETPAESLTLETVTEFTTLESVTEELEQTDVFTEESVVTIEESSVAIEITSEVSTETTEATEIATDSILNTTKEPEASTEATVTTTGTLEITKDRTEIIDQVNTVTPSNVTEPPIADRSVITAPPAVTNLKATGLNNGNIKLSWTGNAEATYYAVFAQRPKSNTMPYLGLSYGSEYTDTKALPGNNFYRVYAVKVVNGTQYFSTSTGYVYANSKVDYAPAPVTNLKAVGLKDGSIQLTWAGNTDATYYAIFAQRPGSNTMPYLSLTYGNKFTDTKALPGNNFYRVYAAKVVGGVQYLSKSTGYVYAKSEIDYKPAPVSSLKASDRQDGTIGISWQRVPNATYYAVFRKGPNATDTWMYQGLSYGSTFVDTLPGYGYNFYRVSAVRVVNGQQHFSPMTTYVYAKATNFQTTTVTDLKLINPQDGRLSLSWTKVTGASAYDVYRSDRYNSTLSYIGTTYGNTYTDTKPIRYGANNYSVRPVKVVEGRRILGTLSAQVSGEPVDNRPGDILTIKALAERAGIRVSWSTSHNATRYDVFRQLPGQGSMSYVATVTTREFLDRSANLPEGTTKYMVIPVRTSTGLVLKGNNSAIVSAEKLKVYYGPKVINPILPLNQSMWVDEYPLVRADEVVYNWVVKEPDSIGSVYGDMLITNKSSKYSIRNVVIHMRLANGDDTYYSVYETFLKGASISEESFASEPMTPITMRYKVLIDGVEAGEAQYVEYSYLTNSYTESWSTR